jgi:hypothetical protein
LREYVSKSENAETGFASKEAAMKELIVKVS